MEGLALGLEEASRPTAGQCISAGFACRAFEADKRAGATSSHELKDERLPTLNEAGLEPAPTRP
jgi:hypothetical protein